MGGRAKLTFIILIISSMTAFAQVDETADSVAMVMEADTSAVWVLPELFSAYDSTFSFIHFNDDTLFWGKDSMPLVRFYEKWDRVNRTHKGYVHIMHIRRRTGRPRADIPLLRGQQLQQSPRLQDFQVQCLLADPERLSAVPVAAGHVRNFRLLHAVGSVHHVHDERAGL